VDRLGFRAGKSLARKGSKTLHLQRIQVLSWLRAS
jgi:hypothetical protein